MEYLNPRAVQIINRIQNKLTGKKNIIYFIKKFNNHQKKNIYIYTHISLLLILIKKIYNII